MKLHTNTTTIKLVYMKSQSTEIWTGGYESTLPPGYTFGFLK